MPPRRRLAAAPGIAFDDLLDDVINEDAAPGIEPESASGNSAFSIQPSTGQDPDADAIYDDVMRDDPLGADRAPIAPDMPQRGPMVRGPEVYPLPTQTLPGVGFTPEEVPRVTRRMMAREERRKARGFTLPESFPGVQPRATPPEAPQADQTRSQTSATQAPAMAARAPLPDGEILDPWSTGTTRDTQRTGAAGIDGGDILDPYEQDAPEMQPAPGLAPEAFDPAEAKRLAIARYNPRIQSREENQMVDDAETRDRRIRISRGVIGGLGGVLGAAGAASGNRGLMGTGMALGAVGNAIGTPGSADAMRARIDRRIAAEVGGQEAQRAAEPQPISPLDQARLDLERARLASLTAERDFTIARDMGSAEGMREAIRARIAAVQHAGSREPFVRFAVRGGTLDRITDPAMLRDILARVAAMDVRRGGQGAGGSGGEGGGVLQYDPTTGVVSETSAPRGRSRRAAAPTGDIFAAPELPPVDPAVDALMPDPYAQPGAAPAPNVGRARIAPARARGAATQAAPMVDQTQAAPVAEGELRDTTPTPVQTAGGVVTLDLSDARALTNYGRALDDMGIDRGQRDRLFENMAKRLRDARPTDRGAVLTEINAALMDNARARAEGRPPGVTPQNWDEVNRPEGFAHLYTTANGLDRFRRRVAEWQRSDSNSLMLALGTAARGGTVTPAANAMRQQITAFVNAQLRSMAGQAVTDQEMVRILQGMGAGNFDAAVIGHGGFLRRLNDMVDEARTQAQRAGLTVDERARNAVIAAYHRGNVWRRPTRSSAQAPAATQGGQ